MTTGYLPLIAAAPAEVWQGIADILILLSAALILGAVAARLGQSVIVGYLIAGTLVGPNVLGWISSQDDLFNIAELGVALLLFAIGLEFSPQRLLTLGGALKIGPFQVVLTTVAGWAIAALAGLEFRESLVIGMMAGLSSTACVLRLLTDRAELDSQHGRTALGVLLVQDVAVIPMMLLVSIMAVGGTADMISRRLGLALVFVVGLMALFYGLFNILAPRLLRLLSLRKNRDFPVLLAVIMAIGSAYATHAVELSPALGAFAAGVMLAVSPFAAQIRADTRPLMTVLVTLFFASIGMFGDPVWLMDYWYIVTTIVLAILVGKAGIVALVVKLFGQPWRHAIAAGLCLAQVGEFSFVLATIALGSGAADPLMSQMTFRAMVSATILTLLFTPYLTVNALRMGAWVEEVLPCRRETKPPKRPVEANESANEQPRAESILLIGFGPTGRRVAEGLIGAHKEKMIAIDLNPDNYELACRYGLKAHLGDATQLDILEHAGIHDARIVVLTVPDHTTLLHLIRLLRGLVPEAVIVARSRYHILHLSLIHAGAHEVLNEEDHVGRRLAAQVRRLIGSTGHVDIVTDE